MNVEMVFSGIQWRENVGGGGEKKKIVVRYGCEKKENGREWLARSYRSGTIKGKYGEREKANWELDNVKVRDGSVEDKRFFNSYQNVLLRTSHQLCKNGKSGKGEENEESEKRTDINQTKGETSESDDDFFLIGSRSCMRNCNHVPRPFRLHRYMFGCASRSGCDDPINGRSKVWHR
ncbi:Protein CBG25557 [Caenorhabditis briggsae]|uniref:Protein CBG25557 n=1 Tax=Caenorhabditis briggsae TaxID=6238 RepID=B6IF44_CAEBR|nr:Protein CBG25557 [Caenorhabditis briggsae]CAR98524.1 Protein CBG25557 [Caenorhabditis briggsae]